MPKLVKNEALILRRFRHGDSSLIIHAFTRENGKVPFIAKGARAGGKKPPVPLVPIVLLEMIWAPSTKSELQLLREWSLLESFGPIHKDFEKMAWAQAALEILGRTLIPNEPHETLFDEILDFFEVLGHVDNRYENLLLRFKLKTLKETGYEIDFSETDKIKTNCHFIPSEGRFIESKSSNYGIVVQAGTLRSLSAISKTPYSEINRLRLSGNLSKEINTVLNAAFRNAFDRWRDLESLKLLDPGFFDEKNV